MGVGAAELQDLKIAFGMGAQGVFGAGLPVLAGELIEPFLATARPAGRCGRIALFERAGWRFGAASVDLTDGLEAATLQLYREILVAARGLHLARIWNYVPAINAPGVGGLENYRLFCRGRSVAFEEHHGANFTRFLPAASAVGCAEGALTVVFAASAGAVRHLENPLQVPAYEYPPDYGPRAPSFARATTVQWEGRTTAFISGTAAIRGHATMAPNATREQLTLTFENLREISRACDLGPNLGADQPLRRHFKVYLRHAAELSAVAAAMGEWLLQPGDLVSYLHADICRAQLNVEIEATLWSES